jgi:hypothetical integral membrane protein (TIGR02206 family)
VFLAYGASHWAAIAVLAVGAAVLVAWGRRHRDTATATRVSRVLALAIVVVVVPFQIYVLLPGQWNPRTSLPLQLCDLAWMAAAYALWSRRRWAFALTYYWGLTLTSQAFLTPTLDGRDFPHLDYVMFWGLHLLVVWAAIYLTWGLGLRPDWRGYAIAVAATVGWGLAMLVFNDLAGTNYGFVTAKPPGGSLLDVLGDWPWYLLSELALGSAVWALLTWPWVLRNRRPEKGSPDGATSGAAARDLPRAARDHRAPEPR